MRKITKDSVNAFMQGSTFKSANTSVEVKGNNINLKLHGNTIASRGINSRIVTITTAGWDTTTTKERLNGLPNVKVQTRKGVLHLNDNEWNGHNKQIKI